jgi:hypothetical protein
MLLKHLLTIVIMTATLGLLLFVIGSDMASCANWYDKLTIDNYYVSSVGLPLDRTDSRISQDSTVYDCIIQYGQWGYDVSYDNAWGEQRDGIYCETRSQKNPGDVDYATWYNDVDAMFKNNGVPVKVGDLILGGDIKNYEEKCVNVTRNDQTKASYTIIIHSTVRDPNSGKKPFYWGVAYFASGPNKCNIKYYLFVDNEQAVHDKLNLIEAHMKQLWGQSSKPEFTLTITHYHPFSTEALSNKPGIRGGDVIVTVKDANGKPAANKQVILLGRDLNYATSNIENNPDLIILPSPYAKQWFQGYDITGFPDAYYSDSLHYWKGCVVLRTDSYGQAKFNYADSINYADLEAQMEKSASAHYTLYAYVLNGDITTSASPSDREKRTVIASGSVDIVFDSVAVITKVGSQDPTVSDPKVRVMGMQGDTPAGTTAVTNANIPYKIKIGSYILFNKGDDCEIRWLSGTKYQVFTRPELFKDDGSQAKLWIGIKDFGWYRWVGTTFQDPKKYAMSALGTNALWAVITNNAPAPVKAAWITGSTVFALGFSESQKMNDPLIIEPHSTLLVEWNDDNITLYTIEGTASLYDKNGQSVNVTTGNKGVYDAGEVIGSPTAYKADEFTADQNKAIEAAKKEMSTESQSTSGGLLSSMPPCPCLGLSLPLLVVLAVAIYRVKKR